jgi:hypothetical protein
LPRGREPLGTCPGSSTHPTTPRLSAAIFFLATWAVRSRHRRSRRIFGKSNSIGHRRKKHRGRRPLTCDGRGSDSTRASTQKTDPVPGHAQPGQGNCGATSKYGLTRKYQMARPLSNASRISAARVLVERMGMTMTLDAPTAARVVGRPVNPGRFRDCSAAENSGHCLRYQAASTLKPRGNPARRPERIAALGYSFKEERKGESR